MTIIFNMQKKFITKSAKETKDVGIKIAKQIKQGDIICLNGDLGAGKTTFVQGVAAGLKAAQNDAINSPTFVLLNIYEKGRLPIYHFDLYRLDDVRELGVIGLDEFMYGQGVCLVEWAEKLGKLMPKERLDIFLSHKSKTSREIILSPVGKSYEHFSA